jgi:hypothetical protein
MIPSAHQLAWDNARFGVERFMSFAMIFDRFSKRFVLATLLALSILSSFSAATDLPSCGTRTEECLASCKRFDTGDARLTACNNFCRTTSKSCEPAKSICNGACTTESTDTSAAVPASAPSSERIEASTSTEISASAESPASVESSASKVTTPESAATESATTELTSETPAAVASPQIDVQKTIAQAPKVNPVSTKSAMVKEHDQNIEMLAAIRAGNLKVIRRLIEVQGLNPTYVYAHEFNPQTRQYEGRIIGLRLSDIFNDTNIMRSDAVGLDRVLALFLELGMDVKATLVTTTPALEAKGGDSKNPNVAQAARTAWGPSLRFMEGAKDRDARLRAFEIALQAGLLPNDDIGEWLFAELPQVCGRDRSKFAIQVVDLLIKYLEPSLGASLQDHFWRAGERGPETISDLLDRSFAPPQAKYAYEKTQFALQDNIWEQCTSLSRRINRYLMVGK